MLHMQHAQMLAVLTRQHEAARLRAERSAAKKARPAADPEPALARRPSKVRVRGPRPV